MRDFLALYATLRMLMPRWKSLRIAYLAGLPGIFPLATERQHHPSKDAPDLLKVSHDEQGRRRIA